MTTKTATADTQGPPEADRNEPPKATRRRHRQKASAAAAKNGKQILRRVKTGEKGRKTPLSKAAARTVRTDFNLSLAVFAKMTGIAPNALARWEQAKAARLDGMAAARVGRVARILEGLARVMRRTFIPTWIE